MTQGWQRFDKGGQRFDKGGQKVDKGGQRFDKGRQKGCVHNAVLVRVELVHQLVDERTHTLLYAGTVRDTTTYQVLAFG